MKRRRAQTSASPKNRRPNSDLCGDPGSSGSQVQFLSEVKCHIHPANFGSVRLKLFQNQVTRYGGELITALPLPCETNYYFIFEESVDTDKLKRLVDVSKFPNAVFLKCTWLIQCVKAKTMVEVKGHEILSVSSPPDAEKFDAEFSLVKLDEADQVQLLPQRTETHTTTSENLNEQDIITAGLSVDPTTQFNAANQKEDIKDSEDVAITPNKEPATSETECEEKQIISNICETVSKESENWDKMETEHEAQEAHKLLIKPFPKALTNKFACARPSSSKAVDLNSHITSELEKLAATYKSKNDTWRAVGYQRAIAAIRNYRKEITSREEALKIPGVGGRLADKITEIVESGRLRKVAEVCEGEEASTLRLFMGVWGAGPTTAQSWYVQGFRSLEDLRTKATLTRHQQVGLRLYDDINSRIPRDEVLEIENYVRSAALSLMKGLELVVCGSYRRGKATCGDVDVLITHPDGHSHQHIFKPLLSNLKETGFLTDDLVTQEDNGNQKKYLGVCKLPGEGRKYRRLDVIVVPYSEFATALLYFTGSAHFNRSMRLLATKMGMSLSEHSLRAGIVRQGGEKLTEGQPLDTPTEESVFAHLGLEYRAPQERDH